MVAKEESLPQRLLILDGKCASELVLLPGCRTERGARWAVSCLYAGRKRCQWRWYPPPPQLVDEIQDLPLYLPANCLMAEWSVKAGLLGHWGSDRAPPQYLAAADKWSQLIQEENHQWSLSIWESHINTVHSHVSCVSCHYINVRRTKGTNHHQALAGSRDFQLVKIPGFWKVKSRDFAGSAYRV